jgi:anti-sigma regulatory factor (Ser/Thr protein kinase)
VTLHPKTTLELVNNLAALSELEEILNKFCKENVIERKQWHRCRLVAEELFVNIVNHGYPNGETGKILWVITSREGEIHFEIQDDGIDFSPRTPKPKVQSIDEIEDVGGHGLGLISAMAKSVQYSKRDGLNHCFVVMKSA